MRETARQFLARRFAEKRTAQVNLWAIHPDIEIALFAINPVTKRPFLGAIGRALKENPPGAKPAGS